MRSVATSPTLYSTTSIEETVSHHNLDVFPSFLNAPVSKLDADQYSAEDIDGVTESLFGSGNLNFLAMQSQQTNAAMDLQDSFASRSGDSAAFSYNNASGPLPVINFINPQDRGFGSSGDLDTDADIGRGQPDTPADGHQALPKNTNYVDALTASSGIGVASGSFLGPVFDSDDDNGNTTNTNSTVTTINTVRHGDISNTTNNQTTINGDDITNLGDTITNLGDDITNLGDDITEIIDNTITNLGDTITNLGDDITDIINNIFGGEIPELAIGLDLDHLGVLDTLAGNLGVDLNITDFLQGEAPLLGIDLGSALDNLILVDAGVLGGLGLTLFGPGETSNAAGDTDLTLSLITDLSTLDSVGLGFVGDAVEDVLGGLGLENLDIPLDPLEGLLGDIDLDIGVTVAPVLADIQGIVTDALAPVTAPLENALTDLASGDVQGALDGITDGLLDPLLGGVLMPVGVPGDHDVGLNIGGDLLDDAGLGDLASMIVNPVESLVGDIDTGAGLNLGLLSGSDANEAGDSDINLGLDIDLIDHDILGDNLDIPLDPLEALVGDIDLDLTAGTDLLGQTADPLFDNLAGGNGDVPFLGQIADPILAPVFDFTEGNDSNATDSIINDLTDDLGLFDNNLATGLPDALEGALGTEIVFGDNTNSTDFVFEDIQDLVDQLDIGTDPIDILDAADLGNPGSIVSDIPLWTETPTLGGLDPFISDIGSSLGGDILSDPIAGVGAVLGLTDPMPQPPAGGGLLKGLFG